MDAFLEESSQDLLKCGETASLFFQKPGAMLDPARYEDFWKKLRAASYASTLITKLVTMYSGEDKHVQLFDKVKILISNQLGNMPEILRPSDFDADSIQHQQNVLTTIFFISLYYPFLVSNISLKICVGRLTGLRLKLQSIQQNSPDSQFISELEKSYTSLSYYHSADGLKYIIQQCCRMDYPAQFDYNRTPARIMATSLLFNHLKSKLQSPEKSKLLFETIIQLLQHPSVSDSLLLPLLHMLKVFISCSPHPPIALLPQINNAVTPYYIWPRPYSDFARDVLEIAASETRSPGTTLRTTIYEENPQLIPTIPSQQSDARQQPTGPSPERRCYMLFDREYTRCRHLLDILKQHIPTELSTNESQLRILASIFVAALNVKPDSLGLEYATHKQVGEYYGAAITIMEHALGFSDAQALAYYTAELTLLQKKILSEIGSVEISKTPKPVKIPPLQIISRLLPFSTNVTSTDTTSHSRHHFPKRESFDHLLEIVVESQELVVPGESPPIIKIGIAGGDSTIHNLATGFVALSMNRPDLLNNLDLRFFFIPTCNSDLAHYIGTLDPWYGRHAIVLPKAIQGLYPSVNGSETTSSSVSSSSSQVNIPPPTGRSMSMILPASLQSGGVNMLDLIEEQGKLTTPSSIFYNELESYFRDAKCQLQLCLFRAECFTAEGQSLTIPFFSRAQIGLSAAIEAFKKANDLGSALTEAEVLAYRNFKWNPPTISMKYIQMNPMSVARAIGQQDARVYTNITLAALPVAGDKANFINPNPSNPWLELLLQEDKKKKTNSRDDPRSYHVSQVELIGAELFDISLDGVSYGPYAKVKFTAATHPDKDEIYKLNILTFLPTEGLR